MMQCFCVQFSAVKVCTDFCCCIAEAESAEKITQLEKQIGRLKKQLNSAKKDVGQDEDQQVGWTLHKPCVCLLVWTCVQRLSGC